MAKLPEFDDTEMCREQIRDVAHAIIETGLITGDSLDCIVGELLENRAHQKTTGRHWDMSRKVAFWQVLSDEIVEWIANAT